MLFDIYLFTIVIPAIQMCVAAAIILISIRAICMIIVWLMAEPKVHFPKMRYYSSVVIVLVMVFFLIPDKKEIKSIIILSKLDKYIEERNISMADPGALSSAAISIENVILRIENDMIEEIGEN